MAISRWNAFEVRHRKTTTQPLLPTWGVHGPQEAASLVRREISCVPFLAMAKLCSLLPLLPGFLLQSAVCYPGYLPALIISTFSFFCNCRWYVVGKPSSGASNRYRQLEVPLGSLLFETLMRKLWWSDLRPIINSLLLISAWSRTDWYWLCSHVLCNVLSGNADRCNERTINVGQP